MGTAGPSKTKALWVGAITVAVLAVILIAFGMIGPLFKTGKRPLSAAIQQESASPDLYSQALIAERSGDTTKAAQLAQAALDADSGNSAAKALLERATRQLTGESSTTTSTPTTSTPTRADPAFLKKIADLSSLLPTAFSGFDVGPAAQRNRDVTASGSPLTTEGPIENLLWSVHDRSTPAGARRFVILVSKKAYSHDAASVSLNGITVYFGTDGTRFATASFVRGRYAFEVLAAARSVSPSKLKNTVLKAAKAFPSSPRQ